MSQMFDTEIVWNTEKDRQNLTINCAKPVPTAQLLPEWAILGLARQHLLMELWSRPRFRLELRLPHNLDWLTIPKYNIYYGNCGFWRKIRFTPRTRWVNLRCIWSAFLIKRSSWWFSHMRHEASFIQETEWSIHSQNVSRSMIFNSKNCWGESHFAPEASESHLG
jgi:hypothetical protein